MKNMQMESRPTPVCKSITCDACQKIYADPMEWQEFLQWRDTGGYGNKVFGDMSVVELDLCQYCVKLHLGRFVRVKPHEWPTQP